MLTAPRARVKPSVVLAGPVPRHRRGHPVRVAAGVALVGLILGLRVPAPVPGPRTAEAAAQHFLDTYVDPDGRAVRRERDGDTVSAGQAHALLLAVAQGDRTAFDRIWGWTARHLQHPSGLLARRWDAGRVRDPASDPAADVVAAHALLLAADRFDDPEHLADGLRIAAALRGRGLPPATLDPAAFSALAAATGQRWWITQRRTATEQLRRTAAAGAGTAVAQVRLAAGCDPGGVALAAAGWPELRERAGEGADATTLVAAAAAAGAAGQPGQRSQLLGRAGSAHAARPTHDGAAAVALGHVLLTTGALGAC